MIFTVQDHDDDIIGIMSRPLQVYLDAADFARLEAWARERGWTKSQAIRAAVRALTRPTGEDPLLDLSGVVDGLPPDCSEQFNRYFAETIIAERPADRAGRRRTGKPVRR
jgi:hypothetical protein